MSAQAALIEGGVAFLKRAHNADGGWGASPGGLSDTETTSLAALALGIAGSDDLARIGCDWLTSHQGPEGAWALSEAVPEPGWATAPALIALGWLRAADPSIERGLAWLAQLEGARVPWLGRLIEWLHPRVDLDYGVTGWPWVPGTFGWVEPTSQALIALKSIAAARGRARSRIEDGERLLLDRACTQGGWNYGNRRVLGADLDPYPDTTAFALLALQDRPRDVAAIQSGLGALSRMLQENDSGLALSLGVLCGRAYGDDVSELVARLERRFAATAFLDATRAVAFAVLAASDAANPFLFGGAHA